jgi:hypothetical protein
LNFCCANTYRKSKKKRGGVDPVTSVLARQAMVPGECNSRNMQAQVFIPLFEPQIQSLLNFFERYHHFSEGNEISGFRRDIENIGREKKPWKQHGV